MGLAEWFAAVTNRRYDVIEAQIDTYQGQYSAFGETALMTAVRQGDLTAVNILAPHEAGMLSRPTNMTALMMACEAGNVGIVVSLAPFEHNVSTPNGLTALMIAARVGSAPCVQALVQYGTGQEDAAGLTALDYGVRSQQKAVIVALAFSGLFKPDQIRAAIRTAGEVKNAAAPPLLRLAIQDLTNQHDDVPDRTFEVEDLTREIGLLRSCLYGAMGENPDLQHVYTYNGQAEPTQLLISRFVSFMRDRQHELVQSQDLTASQRSPSRRGTGTRTRGAESAEEIAQLRAQARTLEYILRSAVFRSNMGFNMTSEDVCDRVNAEMLQKVTRIEELKRQIQVMKEEQSRKAREISSVVGIHKEYEGALTKLRSTKDLLDLRTDQLRTYRTYMGDPPNATISRTNTALQESQQNPFHQTRDGATESSLLYTRTKSGGTRGGSNTIPHDTRPRPHLRPAANSVDQSYNSLLSGAGVDTYQDSIASMYDGTMGAGRSMSGGYGTMGMATGMGTGMNMGTGGGLTQRSHTYRSPLDRSQDGARMSMSRHPRTPLADAGY
ncbi:Ankyrin repeat protein 1 [Giardia muris]|uniref:Ankyrin repeat protein 1 n=1 Tax=Giardia muris TaxID=5742 RepID=A0A4Z1T7Z1_GIAMU|nr:Ankyrin repeat protein 1 [Giardia muris]|eukprot:TNJ28699.1 Ankyrin repeat protein 1 [Giardia muris]